MTYLYTTLYIFISISALRKSLSLKIEFIFSSRPQSQKIHWEQELYKQFKYRAATPIFHTFNAHVSLIIKLILRTNACLQTSYILAQMFSSSSLSMNIISETLSGMCKYLLYLFDLM